jgi:hypothetical protein
MSKAKPARDDYFVCQCCGAELPTTATFCRHCGASDECGWGDDCRREELDLPVGYGAEDNDDFDYDEFVASEFPDQADETKRSSKRGFQTAVVVLICISLLASALLYVCH